MLQEVTVYRYSWDASNREYRAINVQGLRAVIACCDYEASQAGQTKKRLPGGQAHDSFLQQLHDASTRSSVRSYYSYNT